MVMEKLKRRLAEHLDADIAEIKAEATFESLGIDSLDTVEMVMELEEELGVALELNEKVATVGELARLIEKKLEQ